MSEIFLTIFDFFVPSREKVSKKVWEIFVDTFLTIFLDVFPFRWPLLRSAGHL